MKASPCHPYAVTTTQRLPPIVVVTHHSCWWAPVGPCHRVVLAAQSVARQRYDETVTNEEAMADQETAEERLNMLAL